MVFVVPIFGVFKEASVRPSVFRLEFHKVPVRERLPKKRRRSETTHRGPSGTKHCHIKVRDGDRSVPEDPTYRGTQERKRRLI